MDQKKKDDELRLPASLYDLPKVPEEIPTVASSLHPVFPTIPTSTTFLSLNQTASNPSETPIPPQIKPQFSTSPIANPNPPIFRKIFWVLLILVLIAVGLFGTAYYLVYHSLNQKLDQINHVNDRSVILPSSPTPTQTPLVCPPNTDSQTASWSTYINQAYGFCFRYPEGLYTDFLTTSDAKTHFVQIHADNPPGSKNFGTDLQLTLLQVNLPLDDFLSSQAATLQTTSKVKTTVGSDVAYQLVRFPGYLETPAVTGYDIIFKHTGTFYSFLFSEEDSAIVETNHSGFPTQQKTFDLVVSSFQLLVASSEGQISK